MANDGNNGYELWRSDETASGTVMVKDPIVQLAIPMNYSWDTTLIISISVHDDTLYFVANDEPTVLNYGYHLRNHKCLNLQGSDDMVLTECRHK